MSIVRLPGKEELLVGTVAGCKLPIRDDENSSAAHDWSR
jgi:hypothetical protein